jgi:hypothetical protein
MEQRRVNLHRALDKASLLKMSRRCPEFDTLCCIRDNTT